MSITTAVTHGSDFGYDTQINDIYAYLNEGGYGDREPDLAGALLTALCEEVDARLPEGASWQPHASEFVIDPTRGDVLPDNDGMADLFRQAWHAVVQRFDQIEATTLGAGS